MVLLIFFMIIPKKIPFSLDILYKIYFYIMLTELFMGGAGRLITIGSLTLRMYLFIGGILLSIFLTVKGYRLNPASKIIMFLFVFLYTFSILNGLLHNADTNRLIDDAKMASFFFILPLFDFLINDRKTINIIVSLLKTSALIMALLYLLVLIALATGLINVQELYEILVKEEFAEEFGFRGESAIMYKGFVYMCMGFFFFLFEEKKLWRIIGCSVIIIAIVLTLTRGLIVAIGIIIIPYFIFNIIFKEKKVLLGITFLVIIIAIALYSIPFYLETLGDKSDDDMVRTIQIGQVIDRINWNSWLIGHGYGIGVPIGLGHLEITYFELFHKQGLIGLTYWFGMLLVLIVLYNRCDQMYRKITTPLIFSVLFLYLESATNPFLINSIGLTLIFIALSTFFKLIKLPPPPKKHVLR
jgi:hypothetical protein